MELDCCHECAKAKAKEPWHMYIGGCKGCAARMLSRCSVHLACKASGKQSEAYRAALAQAGVTHAEVKGWI